MSILVWALMETSPKTTIWIQVVYLGGETKKCPGRSSEWDGAERGAFQAGCHCGQLEHILAMGYWETMENMNLGGIPSEREGPGVFSHLLSVEGFSKGVCISSVHFSHSVMSDSLWPHSLQHSRLPCPSPTPGAYSNSCQLSRWCHPTISSSVVPFSSCLQSFPSSGSFLRSQFFASDVQSIRVSASAQSFQWIFRTDFLQDRLVWSCCPRKGLSRVFSSITIQRRQFFSTQPPLWSSSHLGPKYNRQGRFSILTQLPFCGHLSSKCAISSLDSSWAPVPGAKRVPFPLAVEEARSPANPMGTVVAFL